MDRMNEIADRVTKEVVDYQPHRLDVRTQMAENGTVGIEDRNAEVFRDFYKPIRKMFNDGFRPTLENSVRDAFHG